LPKISENCDHNIDNKLGEFSPIGRLFSLGVFFEKMQKEAIFFSYFLYGKRGILILAKNELGYRFGRFFTNFSGHPDAHVLT
jgi:hypothetical protein